jgi:hypothetical protein
MESVRIGVPGVAVGRYVTRQRAAPGAISDSRQAALGRNLPGPPVLKAMVPVGVVLPIAAESLTVAEHLVDRRRGR